jgi:hypothetical protein
MHIPRRRRFAPTVATAGGEPRQHHEQRARDGAPTDTTAPTLHATPPSSTAPDREILPQMPTWIAAAPNKRTSTRNRLTSNG